jgi:hypothetical protein
VDRLADARASAPSLEVGVAPEMLVAEAKRVRLAKPALAPIARLHLNRQSLEPATVKTFTPAALQPALPLLLAERRDAG